MEINWQPLIVVSADRRRRAIYGETLPDDLERAFALHPEARKAFDQTAAEQVLRAFAGTWPDLDIDHSGQYHWHMKGFPTRIQPDVVIGFFGDELAPGLIVSRRRRRSVSPLRHRPLRATQP